MTKWFVILTALIVGVPMLLIWMLRYVPPPTTSFMLQSEVLPVQYQWVPTDRIAAVVGRAVVAAEDQKFWDHSGFDLEAMDKAYRDNQKGHHNRGGSTISQQTAKNLFLWPGGGYFRKGIEAGLTILIEAFWSKQRILEVYLNIAEFGPGVYGVEAASQEFFGKPAASLSPNEAARLAAVLPNPRRWNAARPGTYVTKRSAWIMRQMGHATQGQSEPVEEPQEQEEPLEQEPNPDQEPAVPNQPEPLQPEVKPEEPPVDGTATEPNGPVEPMEEKPADGLTL